MLTMVSNYVDYKAFVSKSEVKVTHDVKGQNFKIYTLSWPYCCIFMKLGKYEGCPRITRKNDVTFVIFKEDN